MSVTIETNVVGVKEVVGALQRANPKKNTLWVGRALKESASLVQARARSRYIKRGGRIKTGSKSFSDSPALPNQLTSRSGRLRDSIRVDYRKQSQSVGIGTHVVYGRIHELGGSIRITPKMRRVLHAKGIHPRSSTTVVRMPKRPYLAPALRDASREIPSIFIRAWERAV